MEQYNLGRDKTSEVSLAIKKLKKAFGPEKRRYNIARKMLIYMTLRDTIPEEYSEQAEHIYTKIKLKEYPDEPPYFRELSNILQELDNHKLILFLFDRKNLSKPPVYEVSPLGREVAIKSSKDDFADVYEQIKNNRINLKSKEELFDLIASLNN